MMRNHLRAIPIMGLGMIILFWLSLDSFETPTKNYQEPSSSKINTIPSSIILTISNLVEGNNNLINLLAQERSINTALTNENNSLKKSSKAYDLFLVNLNTSDKPTQPLQLKKQFHPIITQKY